MKNTRSKAFLSVAIILIVAAFASELVAQCPMCRIAAESNLKNGGTAGRGLNDGILYLFAMPYLVVGLIGFVWWRNRKKLKEAGESEVI